MTSMTMFTQSQNPSNFVRIYSILKLDGFLLEVKRICIDFGLNI